MMLTQRPVVGTSVVVVTVFSDERLAYGGGRHGFGGVPVVEAVGALRRQKLGSKENKTKTSVYS
eukprot:scaffold24084_cov77-Cyclotella_meneghiniana.AAC.2